jgi:hypothetical protein
MPTCSCSKAARTVDGAELEDLAAGQKLRRALRVAALAPCALLSGQISILSAEALKALIRAAVTLNKSTAQS